MNSKREDLINRLKQAGAKNPKSWASSEISENIAQFGRFLMLKNLTQLHNDIQGNLSYAGDIGCSVAPEYQALCEKLANGTQKPESVVVYEKLCELLGEQNIAYFLHDYGKGLIGQVIDLLDEGNYNLEQDKVGWLLVETDEHGMTTDRPIQGLHEDFLEFEENELIT
ncbi:hypothetical protein VQ643_06825 [Pseudomonas sp. F1_0610]|uniref:hypothetical protein n=1 Tax=Pseudomonas sp. F1_0610 TaxID=3114284 RepID=UPI0039C22459